MLTCQRLGASSLLFLNASNFFFLDNLRSHERNSWLKAKTKTGPSVLRLQGTESYKQLGRAQNPAMLYPDFEAMVTLRW